MAKSPAHNSHDQSTATLRQLKLLILLLVLSNIGLGIFSVYLMRVLDQRYTMLIDNSVPVLADLRELLTYAVAGQRSSGTTVLLAPEAQRPGLIAAARKALERDRSFRTKLLTNESIVNETEVNAALRRAGEAHDTISAEALKLIAAGNVAEATAFRERELRPAFDAYLAAIGAMSDLIEKRSLRDSDEITTKMNSMSKMMLSVASWPVILLMGLLLLTAVFVVVLMVLFRGREMGDMP